MLLARQFGKLSSKIHIQQPFRTRNRYGSFRCLEGLRSQGFPNEEVAVRWFEIMQKFIDGVRSFELKRNLTLMYAQEKYHYDTHPSKMYFCHAA